MTRDARRAQNEVWFREVNERLEARALERAAADAFEIVCECASEECTERIELTAAEYERVRAEPTRFILVLGHDDPSLERIVLENGTYAVVDKIGAAAFLAELEDPRS